MEIPVAFPSSDPYVRTYVINDINGTIRYAESGGYNNVNQTGHHKHHNANKNNKVVSFLPLLPSGEKNRATNETFYSTSNSNDGTTGSSVNDHGSASVSVVSFPSNKQQHYGSVTDTYIVTTSPIVTNETSLSNNTTAVSLFDTTKQEKPVSIIHLDFGTETQQYSKTIKVQAFATVLGSTITHEQQNVIQISFIDRNGFVITINLSLHGLEPMSIVHCLSIGMDILDPVVRDTITVTTIRSSMVYFLSATTLLVSFNPFLMAIDLTTKVAVQWSKSICLEEMRVRDRANESGFVGSIFGMFMGSSSSTTTETTTNSTSNHVVDKDIKLTSTGGTTTILSSIGLIKRTMNHHILLDMNPVAAITVADNDPTQLFTLHADGYIRRWVIPKHDTMEIANYSSAFEGGTDNDRDYYTALKRLKPLSVYDCDIYPSANAKIIPSPELWCDDDDSTGTNCIQMTARMYDHNELFVLALYIQTTTVGTSNVLDTFTYPQTDFNSVSSAEDPFGATDVTEYEDFGSTPDAIIQRNNTTSDTSNNNCHLVVLDGRIGTSNVDSDETGNTYGVTKVHCIALQPPPNVSSLVGMSFDSQQDRCSIKALFVPKKQPTVPQQQQQREQYPRLDMQPRGANAVIVTYPPSSIAIVSREPQILSSSHLLSSIAMDEYQRICELSFHKHLGSTSTPSEQELLDNLLHRIDSRYLQYLFRPIVVRGTGAVLPPSSVHIRKALQRRTGRRQIGSTGTAGSLEVQVIKTIHEWRKGDINNYAHTNKNDIVSKPSNTSRIVQFADTPHKDEWKVSHSANVTTLTTPAKPGTTKKVYPRTPIPSKSIYELLDMNDDTDNMDITTIPETSIAVGDRNDISINSPAINEATTFLQSSAGAGFGTRTIQKECKLHEERWRKLLLDIWEEEERERVPLAFFVPHKTMLEDSLLIVRAGSVSVISPQSSLITSHHAATSSGVHNLSSLDNLAVKLLEILETSHAEYHVVKDAEQYILEVISSGRMAIDEKVVTVIESRLRSAGTDSIMSLLDLDECKQDIDDVENASESELLQQLLNDSLIGSIRGFDVFSTAHSDTSDKFDCISDHQVRLTGSSLIIRTMYSLQRVFLSRFLILSELLSSRDAVRTALRMYLHISCLVWVAGQSVPMPRVVDATNSSMLIDTETNSPPKKRNSLGGNVHSILNGQNDKTTTLDCSLIHLARNIGLSYTSRSLSTLTMSLAEAGIKSIIQFSIPSTDQSISFSKLPELSILSQSGDLPSVQANLVERLLAPYLEISDVNEMVHVTALREELMAKALLETSLNVSNETLATEKILKAFKLLQFDEYDSQNGMHRIRTLSFFAAKNQKVAKHFLNFVASAIDKLDSLPADSHRSSDQYSKLWSILFDTSVSIRAWNSAFNACIDNPIETERTSNCNRLVVAMVDAGALAELLELCLQLNTEIASDTFANSFKKCGYLYGIAVQELEAMSKRDLYTQGAIDSEPPSDYNGALHALFVARKDWKLAAQAMDIRYMNGIKCLSKTNDGLQLTIEDRSRREEAIVKDLVTAANGCLEAVLNITSVHERFLVSGESCHLPSVPPKVAARLESKRYRDTDLRHSQAGAPGLSSSNRLERFMDLNSIEALAVRCNALQVLFKDNSCEKEFVTTALLNTELNLGLDQEIIWKLFDLGYYQEGLTLAKSLSNQLQAKPAGHDPFYNELACLITEYLIPLTVDVGNFGKRTPTIGQLNACFASVSDSPVLLRGARHLKITHWTTQELQSNVALLIEKLVLCYVRVDLPIAKDVAETMLLSRNPTMPLPDFLEQMLLKGTCQHKLPGLFARRRKEGIKGYLGDPLMLLNIYIASSRFADACRVVSAVLDDQDLRDASNRLPEKGEIDFVPFDKIDRLWNMIEDCLVTGSCGLEETRKMESARNSMETSLENHFRRLKISHQGITSSRSLAL